MVLAVLAVLSGLLLLVWSADKFVEGSAATARHFGMPSLLIGMVIIGFGTSAPLRWWELPAQFTPCPSALKYFHGMC